MIHTETVNGIKYWWDDSEFGPCEHIEKDGMIITACHNAILHIGEPPE